MTETAENEDQDGEQTGSSPESRKPAQLREIDAETLFAGGKQVVIHHAGEAYRLILTRNNRLILQK